jgi:hypothetical protein
MNIELQPELNNNIKQEINSYYRVLNVSQQGSLPSFNASKNQILVEIPSDLCFNPSLLSISFTRGDTSTSGASTFNAIPNYAIPYFSRCELYSSSNNIRLVDIQNLDIYNKMSIGLYNQFLQNQNYYLCSSDRVAVNNGVTGDFFYDSGVPSDRFITYCTVEEAAGATLALKGRTISIKLCDLCPNSFFSINRNIYSSSVLYLRLETNQLNNILFNFGSDATTSNINSVTTSIAITNFQLSIFCEANPDLINIARQQQESKEGLALVLPEVNNAQYSIAASAGTRGSIVKVVNNSSADSRLYMVLSSLTNTKNANSTYTINNMSNHNATTVSDGQGGFIANPKYNQVQLYVNSNQIVNFDTNLNQDMSYVDHMFKNHSFNSNLAFKNISPFVYVFSTKKIENNLTDGNLLDGCVFPSGGEITLNILYNCVNSAATSDTAAYIVNPFNNTGYNHNIFTITKKKIYLKQGKFSYVPFV